MFTRGCQQHEFPLGYADYVQSNNWQGYQHVNTLVLNDEKMLRSLGGGQAVYLLVNIQKTIAIYNEFAHLKRWFSIVTLVYQRVRVLGLNHPPQKKKSVFTRTGLKQTLFADVL